MIGKREQALRAAFEPAEGVAKDSLLAEARGRLSPPRIPDFVMIPLPQRFSFHPPHTYSTGSEITSLLKYRGLSHWQIMQP